MYKLAARTSSAMPAQRGRTGDPGPKGKAQGAVKRRPCSVAVELDVFGKGQLCEDEVKVMIR